MMRKYQKEIMASILLIIMLFICSMSYAYAMSAPISSVIITSENVSYEEKVPSSWQVEKSAKLISKGKARVTFDVDTTLMSKEEASDIIFVVDTSGSMEGDKLNRVKTDSTSFINDILSNANNRISLIEFNSYATIHTDFTNDKDLLMNEINSLEVSNSTNYYNAFLKVDELLQNYQKEDNREVIMMFLTDGYPYEGNPNQVTEYKYLKEAYPYLTVNAIQYEMGDVIIDQLKEVSDNQYIAYTTNLNDILGEASITPIPYEEFQIIDYIDNVYYTLNSVDDIKVSDGEVSLTEENGTQKITWTIPNYLSGRKTKLTMDISLKDEYIGQGGVYSTNKGEEVISSIENQHEDVNSNLTPTLAEKYQVIYEGNAPEGSSVENIPDSEAQSVFDMVEITEEEPTCNGYIFQGWEIVTDNVKKVGSDYFIMPEENAILRAKWSKIELAKSMDGVVSEQGDPIMKGRDWWTSEYDRADITSIVVKTNTDISDTAIYSWDVSQAKDTSVIAYLEDDGSGNETYKVTIGGRGGVIANSTSASLFENFTGVININLNNFDTSNVTNMLNMFYGCTNLSTLNISNFNTSKVTIMQGMFRGCTNLLEFSIGELDTSKVTTMYGMFWNCSSLASLDVSSFNTFNVTNMANMFSGCSDLLELNLSSFRTSEVTNMSFMFDGCNHLENLDISTFDTSNVTNMGFMFRGCNSLTALPLIHFNTSKVNDMQFMFSGCSHLSEFDVSNFNTSNVTNMSHMFGSCSSVESLDVSSFDTSKVTSMEWMFSGCGSLVELDISQLDTSSVTTMVRMFSGCSRLIELDVSNFNTSKVKNMSTMFNQCSSLTKLDLSSFDTSEVTDMTSMFSSCSSLESLDLKNFNTEKVIKMSFMFNTCRSLISLDVSNFNTSNITDFTNMFNGCGSLSSLDLSSFDTSNVTSVSHMFNGCISLRKLDFRNVDFSAVTNYVNMFNGTSNLEVFVKDEDVRSWVQDKLGGHGTAVIVDV